jgi:hypothetical protein
MSLKRMNMLIGYHANMIQTDGNHWIGTSNWEWSFCQDPTQSIVHIIYKWWNRYSMGGESLI